MAKAFVRRAFVLLGESVTLWFLGITFPTRQKS